MSVPRRIDLRESLEAYAARVRMRVYDARPLWRREALRLLGVACPLCRGTGRVRDPLGSDPCEECEGVVPDTTSGLCAIAPGVTVATAFVDWPDDYAGGAS